MVCVNPITACVLQCVRICAVEWHSCCSDVSQFTIYYYVISMGTKICGLIVRELIIIIRFALETIINTIIRSRRRNYITIYDYYYYYIQRSIYSHCGTFKPQWRIIIIISLHPLSMCNSLNGKYVVRSYRDNREYIIIIIFN